MIGGPTRRRSVLIHEFVNGGGLAGTEWPTSMAAEGLAMRRALAREFAAVEGIDVILTRDARQAIEETGPWRTVPIEPGAEPETFARLAASADFTIAIAPETGGILQRRAAIIERAGGRSLGSTPEAIRWTGDKWALHQCWLEHGITTPPTRLIRPRDPIRSVEFADPFPVVLKPVDGAGSIETFYLSTWGSPIPAEVSRMDAALAQPFVAGTPLSASFLVDGRGRAELVCVARQRMAIRDGRIHYEGGSLPVDRAFCDQNIRWALEAVEGLRGWVGVDLIRIEESGRTSVLEINPRPTTTLVGVLGLLRPGSLAEAWLAAIEGGGAPIDWAELWPAGRSLIFDADGTIHDDEVPVPEPERT